MKRSTLPLPLKHFRPEQWGERFLRSRLCAVFLTLSHLAIAAGLLAALLPR